MDFAVIISPLASALIAIVGAYIATKNSNNDKFAALQAQNAEQTAELRSLKDQVEKHNNVIERTFKLESDVHTAFKRIDELKDRDDKLEQKIDNLM